MANNAVINDVKEIGVNIEISKKIKKTLKLMEKVGCDDAKKELQETLELVTGLNDYALSKSTQLSSLLKSIVEETAALSFTKLQEEGKLIVPRSDDYKMIMISSSSQVQLLQFFIRKLKCRNILEIGTYMGYGAFGMADVMAQGGKVTGIDIEPHFCDFVNKTARERNINVEVKQGSAITVLESLAKEGNKYDFIYVDCHKPDYCEYFKIIMNNGMLLPDGMMACDNVLWHGRSIKRSDYFAECMDDFNTMVAADPRVTTTLLPCYDGLLLIQHNDNGE